MARVLLVLPSATYRAPDFLAAADELGVEVVVASEGGQALAQTMGERFLPLPLSRPAEAADRIVTHAETVPLDAVLAVDDEGVETAALASARLGLAHNPPEAVAATRDKARMRRALSTTAVAQPDFRVVEDGADVGTLAQEMGFPCVVKPVSLSASRGVIRADDAGAARAAQDRIRGILSEVGDPNGPLLVESYVRGDEVAVEALMRGGELEVLAVFDKPDPLTGPYFAETLYITPARLPGASLDAVRRAAASAAATLGLREGPVHAELRVAEEGATVLELAARSIGGLCSRTLRFGMGSRLEDLILRHALGLPVDDTAREADAAGVSMLPIPVAGTLAEVAGQGAVRALPGVAELELTLAPGQPVRPLPEGDRYLGFVHARGDTPDEVEATLRAATERLEVRIIPAEEGDRSP
jgi:biotin carboxylase